MGNENSLLSRMPKAFRLHHKISTIIHVIGMNTNQLCRSFRGALYLSLSPIDCFHSMADHAAIIQLLSVPYSALETR